MGKFCDKSGIKPAYMTVILSYCLCCILFFGSWYLREFWSAATCCFVWGLMQVASHTLLLVICSRVYDGEPESFAVVKQLHGFVFILYQIFTILTKNSFPVSMIMCVLLVLGVPAFYCSKKIMNEPETRY